MKIDVFFSVLALVAGLSVADGHAQEISISETAEPDALSSPGPFHGSETVYGKPNSTVVLQVTAKSVRGLKSLLLTIPQGGIVPNWVMRVDGVKDKKGRFPRQLHIPSDVGQSQRNAVVFPRVSFAPGGTYTATAVATDSDDTSQAVEITYQVLGIPKFDFTSLSGVLTLQWTTVNASRVVPFAALSTSGQFRLGTFDPVGEVSISPPQPTTYYSVVALRPGVDPANATCSTVATVDMLCKTISVSASAESPATDTSDATWLSVKYVFDHPFSSNPNLNNGPADFTITGQLLGPPEGQAGVTNFVAYVGPFHVTGGTQQSIPDGLSGGPFVARLRRGNWSLTAQSTTVGGSATCSNIHLTGKTLSVTFNGAKGKCPW
jgi:hypothetical protein